MQNIFLILSTIIGLLTPIIGIRSILKGEFKPQRITRFIFLILTSIFVASLFAQGNQTAIYLAVLQWTGSLAVFILSIKFGVGGTDKSDMAVLFLALTAIVIWKVTDNPALALYMSLFADFIGILPTLIKSFFQPQTEDPKFYFSDVLAGLFSLLAIRSLVFADIVFPAYIFLINFICVILIFAGRKFKIKKIA
jgi:hypothetical protein